MYDSWGSSAGCYASAGGCAERSAAAAGCGDPEDEPTGRLISDVRSRLSAVIAAQLDGGLVPGWVDPEAMAALIIAAANGIALQGVLDPGGASVSRQADQLLRLFLATAVQTGAADGVGDSARIHRLGEGVRMSLSRVRLGDSHSPWTRWNLDAVTTGPTACSDTGEA